VDRGGRSKGGGDKKEIDVGSGILSVMRPRDALIFVPAIPGLDVQVVAPATKAREFDGIDRAYGSQ